MIRNLWIFLREVRWFAVLAVACMIAGIVLILLDAPLLGIGFAVSSVTLSVLATTD